MLIAVVEVFIILFMSPPISYFIWFWCICKSDNNISFCLGQDVSMLVNLSQAVFSTGILYFDGICVRMDRVHMYLVQGLQF